MESPPESGAELPSNMVVKRMLEFGAKKVKAEGRKWDTPWKMDRWKDVPVVRESLCFENTGKEKDDAIKEYLKKFMKFYNRWEEPNLVEAQIFKENKVEYWIQQVDRLELDLVCPRLEYWTREGRVTRFKIEPPRHLDDFEDRNRWKVIAFHDFHQDLPLMMSLPDFESIHGSYLVDWYSNWRKWSYEAEMWHFAASEDVVPLTTEESPESKFNKKIFFAGYRRLAVYSIKSWKDFDKSKSEMQRNSYLEDYFMEDAGLSIIATLASHKTEWYKERTVLWNAGVMRDDGTLICNLYYQYKFGPEAYQSAVNELSWIGCVMPDYGQNLEYYKQRVKDEQNEKHG